MPWTALLSCFVVFTLRSPRLTKLKLWQWLTRYRRDDQNGISGTQAKTPSDTGSRLDAQCKLNDSNSSASSSEPCLI